ncbi:hypothetical protein OsI_06926 [Oryza sativa Indica Group]|uniref:Uncharacterized protein n=1 Tax=Oryza sativa subsp. indica TaxID=39946 RepID=A2X3Z3_ORYSI|nr:hypothetical protein OsI_06926 [Oryza sativa Indica Group]
MERSLQVSLIRCTLIATRPLSPTLLAPLSPDDQRTDPSLCAAPQDCWGTSATPPTCLAIGSWSNWHDYILMAPAPEPTSAFSGANLVAGRWLQQFWPSA